MDNYNIYTTSLRLFLVLTIVFISLNKNTSQIVRPQTQTISRLNCSNFTVALSKSSNSDHPSNCCYNISISNKNTGFTTNTPNSIKFISDNANLISTSASPQGWVKNTNTTINGYTTIEWKKAVGNIPSNFSINLGDLCFTDTKTNPIVLKYEWINSRGRTLCRDSSIIESCSGGCKNLIINGNYVNGIQPGIMPNPGSAQNWTKAYGSPIVNDDPNNGFVEPGCIMLSGNNLNGDAASQGFSPSNKIITGRHYKLSIAVRFLSSENSLNYVRLRAVAFNGINSTIGNSHPQPSASMTILGRSGKIFDCNDWSVIEFPVWTANADFNNIAINAFTNDLTTSKVYIDEVILCESSKGPCDELQVDGSNNPVIPSGFGNLPSGMTCYSEAEEDNYYNGNLVNLYPGYNGTTDLYQNGLDPCMNVGGTLPGDVIKYNCDDSLKALGINMTCEELEMLLNTSYDPEPIMLTHLPPLQHINNSICDTVNEHEQLVNLNNMAFKGRDIIYVHGLMLRHLCDRANNKPGSNGNWPADPNEFYSGYYKNVANNNWKYHIDYFKTSKGNLNRYLIVSYNCSQPAEVAVHSILSQIREAMENGTGVVADPSDPRGSYCFGRDYVMISHSTGALVADVAISIANKTKTDLNLQSKYGDISLISDRCKGRISIRGAQSGSNLATIMAYAQADPALSALASFALTATDMACDQNSTLSINQNMVKNSILIDLVPPITRFRWASYIDDISVPVITIASGHPSAIIPVLKYSLLPGFDDGVLHVDCANGNNNTLSPTPSCFNANPVKVFDMGIPKIRAINYFLDQKVGAGLTGVFASGSTPYLSPSGMVQPVNSVLVDPQIHFRNHFSFIQSASEHWLPNIHKDFTTCEYDKTIIDNSSNTEEELVVTNASLYSAGIIDPAIISQMQETIRDQHIMYPWIKIVYRRGIPRPTIYWKKFYIWKRTYHTLIDNCMYDADYAYKYLFKQ